MTSEKFANRLKSLRERDFQLTQAQFATLVGMGVATINRYENGTEPTDAYSHDFGSEFSLTSAVLSH